MKSFRRPSLSTYINTNALILSVAILISAFAISTVFAQTTKSDSGNATTPLKPSSFYITTEGPFSTEPFVAKTVSHSCEVGDIAIGGGMYKFEKDADSWRTIMSAPAVGEDQSKWTTSVEFERNDTGRFWVATKCIDMAPLR